MRVRRSRHRAVCRVTGRRAGLALIELVVAIAIIAVLAAAFYGVWGRGDDDEKSLPEQAKDRAKDVECRNMIRQVRMSIDMEKMGTGELPPSIPSDVAPYAKCPRTGKAYAYDPQTGRVTCTTPGHEDY
jgi:prepilin-type N-terminal cleavage/methylation domain-containing protein